jgi:pimeloyl-ACP methyl ester carboxylesterase
MGVERGAGTPLLLLHGFGVDHRLLLPLDPTIEAAGGWRRIYLDLPGCGASPIGTVASTEDVAAAVRAEIRARIGEEPFAVLGNSFGGMLARRVAHDLREQVLGLATIAAVFVAAQDHRDVPAQTVLLEDQHLLAGLGEAGEAYREVAVIQTARNARAFLAHAYPGLLAADAAGLDRIAARYAFDAEPEDASPAPFTRPALFITGRQDHVVGYRDALARLDHYPRASVAVLDGAGHNVHLDQPDATATLLGQWLEQVRADAR